MLFTDAFTVTTHDRYCFPNSARITPTSVRFRGTRPSYPTMSLDRPETGKTEIDSVSCEMTVVVRGTDGYASNRESYFAQLRPNAGRMSENGGHHANQRRKLALERCYVNFLSVTYRYICNRQTTVTDLTVTIITVTGIRDWLLGMPLY